ncbi:Nfu1 protein [Starmerella bacillaris]|uniref:Nfu1 protein n=1 Tax=Starmerella bacillaris TaxID=1247836 RepID=A0AAV5RPN5_STABA|nr:Nfu1 protein [Starmerella bacillaris]
MLALRRIPRIGSRLIYFRNLYIQTASTPNEDALKFLPSQSILGAGARTIEILNYRDAIISPLAEKLFGVAGVNGILLGPDFITVEKAAEEHWNLLKPQVLSLITEHLTSGEPVINTGILQAEDTAYDENDSDAVSMIKELIDTRIRPAIQDDGGDIQYKGFENGIVKLKLQGACRSCDSSSITLTNGIQSMLMHYVEEVKGVEQVLDEEEKLGIEAFEKFENDLEQNRPHTNHS